jgi:hypothetical protein
METIEYKLLQLWSVTMSTPQVHPSFSFKYVNLYWPTNIKYMIKTMCELAGPVFLLTLATCHVVMVFNRSLVVDDNFKNQTESAIFIKFCCFLMLPWDYPFTIFIVRDSSILYMKIYQHLCHGAYSM